MTNHSSLIRLGTLLLLFSTLATVTTQQSAAAAGPSWHEPRITVDVPAPSSFATKDVARRGGIAARIDFVDGHANSESSEWYRLNYVDGGSRLQVFEHYATTASPADEAMMNAQETGWKIANQIVDASAAPPALPEWALVHTGRDTGYSAGLMMTLAYLDVLTSGRLVGGLRVAGTGGIGSDGVVMPVNGVDAKLAAAMLTRPDIVFATSAPHGIRNVTIVDSDHTRLPTSGSAVAAHLNLTGYRNAGQVDASSRHDAHVAVVHDVRQALAYLCGYTALSTTCELADRSAALPIGSPTN